MPQTISDHINFFCVPKEYKNKSIIFIVLIFIVFISTFITAFLFAPLGFDSHHQGLMFQGAMSFINDKMLYKDVYYHYGPLTALLHSFSLYIGGQNVYSIQIITVIFYSLSSVLLFVIWSRFMPVGLAVLSYVIWLGLAPFYVWILLPWSSDIALLFLLLSAFMLIVYIETGKLKYLFFTGMVVAFTFWSRQTVGLILFFAVSFFIIVYVYLNARSKIKEILLYFAGFVLVSAVFFGWLIFNHSAADFVNKCFINQFDTMVDRSSYLSFIKQLILALFPISPKTIYGETFISLWALFPVILIFLFLEFIVFLFLKRNEIRGSVNKNTWSLFSFVVISLASWLQYYPVTCIRHIFWAATPFMGIVVYFLWNTTVYCLESIFVKRYRALKVFYFLLLTGIFSVLLIDMTYRIVEGRKRYKLNDSELITPAVLSRLKVASSVKEGLKIISDSINSFRKEESQVKLVSLSNGYNGKWTMFLYPFFVSQTTQKGIEKSTEVVLFHSADVKNIDNYHLLVHVSFYPPLLYDKGWNSFVNQTKTDFYLYAPNNLY
jgi:4-amino-4-deoxy-L-arabinose transferase-like glycosyltransferase